MASTLILLTLSRLILSDEDGGGTALFVGNKNLEPSSVVVRRSDRVGYEKMVEVDGETLVVYWNTPSSGKSDDGFDDIDDDDDDDVATEDETLEIMLSHSGEAWLGFGVPIEGSGATPMHATAVVGTPRRSEVEKYWLKRFSESESLWKSAKRMSRKYQTLDGRVELVERGTDVWTELSFKTLLHERYRHEVSKDIKSKGENTFLLAVGTSGKFVHHGAVQPVGETYTLRLDLSSPATTPAPTRATTPSPTTSPVKKRLTPNAADASVQPHKLRKSRRVFVMALTFGSSGTLLLLACLCGRSYLYLFRRRRRQVLDLGRTPPKFITCAGDDDDDDGLGSHVEDLSQNLFPGDGGDYTDILGKDCPVDPMLREELELCWMRLSTNMTSSPLQEEGALVRPGPGPFQKRNHRSNGTWTPEADVAMQSL